MRWIAALASGMVACSTGPMSGPRDAASIDAGAVADASAVPSDLSFAQPDMAQPPADAGDPPRLACATDGAAPDGGLCPLPPSTCVDSFWLVYYTGGTCTGGACQWDKHFMQCFGGCVANGCNSGFTWVVTRTSPPA